MENNSNEIPDVLCADNFDSDNESNLAEYLFAQTNIDKQEVDSDDEKFFLHSEDETETLIDLNKSIDDEVAIFQFFIISLFYMNLIFELVIKLIINI